MKPVFFFAGWKRPVKEFTGLLEQLGRPYVKFHDTDNRWFMDPKWKNEIQQALDKHGPPALSIGCSMGGFAALYHQPQIRADMVLAFGPQGTSISSEVKSIGGYKADAWAKNLKSITGNRLPPPCGNYSIYFGNHTDTGIGNSGHSQLITKAGYNITTIELSNPNEHDVAKVLYQDGKLIDIIKMHLNS